MAFLVNPEVIREVKTEVIYMLKDETPHTNRVPQYRNDNRSRARSQGGPIRRPHDRKLDTSPYSSGTYLSPPTDTGWRRTNSDSALHQSTMQGMVDRNSDSARGWNIPLMNGPDRNLDGRPRSSCDVPSSRVPGISIHPSAHDPSMIQIPIANTGSLPDLTSVDFSSPIHAPLDQDHDSSPYSSSPVNTSPSTLSPTSIHQSVQPGGRFHFTPTSHAHSNVPLDKNVVNLVDGTDFTQMHGMTGMYQQPCQPPTSSSPTLQQAAGYRSPRPSPQSSPSPGGRHSAPCSPGAPSPLPNDYHIFNQHQASFQQQFEHLSMVSASLECRACNAKKSPPLSSRRSGHCHFHPIMS
ncbi:hypothetical protein NQ318_016375 [Aromia moschata]|uniref:Transducer of regulated CREB activity middle domain-containing protein n=1 Tax=Aromia moschata TaxID=1265417 RepID=A0AAV8Z420_9CUCU|nr:hypothetical protein NQ318_016375 [Aromia moschata]